MASTSATTIPSTTTTSSVAPPEGANAECVGPASETAGKASSCAGCPNQSACASGKGRETDPALAEVAERMNDIKHKILVLSGKGGVGKSTVSSQLAWALRDQGFTVGILDIDICGPTVPQMMGVELQEVSLHSLCLHIIYPICYPILCYSSCRELTMF
jgi:Mrp family chromosome partitioning ATPase